MVVRQVWMEEAVEEERRLAPITRQDRTKPCPDFTSSLLWGC